MRILRLLPLAALGSLLLTSCVKRMPEANPSDIPSLEEALARNPGNPEILTQLGMARYQARQYAEAETTLEEAVQTGQAPEAAYLYLGLAREDQEKWGEARDAYTMYVQEGRHGELRDEISQRLALMARRELRAQAQTTLGREDEISAQDPTPRSVAVFPFRITTEDENLAPLQVALADMMTTDLKLSGGLTVLERAQVQSLLDEMALTEAGFTSPETGARAGRMLRAEHVVQGALTSMPRDLLRFDTDVLDTSRRTSAGEASAEDLLAQLFDMEKETVFQVLDILGVTITPAEREAIDENRAANLLAFLAYGRGLMAMDDGNYSEAQEYFNQSLTLDQSFGPAQSALDGVLDVLQATAVTTQGISALALPNIPTETQGVVTNIPTGAPGVIPENAVPIVGGISSVSSLLDNLIEGVVPTPSSLITNLGSISNGADIQGQVREPTQESSGQNDVTNPTTAIIQITITRPGGED